MGSMFFQTRRVAPAMQAGKATRLVKTARPPHPVPRARNRVWQECMPFYGNMYEKP